MDGDGPKESTKPVDRCKMTTYERQRTKDAWLAAPKYKPPKKPDEKQLLVRKTSYGLALPALKAKCSPHIEALAVAKFPLRKIHYVTKAEREAQRELEEEMTKEELKWLKRPFFPVAQSGVKKSALFGKTTPRIDYISKAKLSFLTETKKRNYNSLNQTQRKFLNQSIKEHYENFNINYPPEADKIYVIVKGVMVHPSCFGKVGEKGKRARYLCELNKNQRKIFRKRMKQMGLPKKNFQQDKGPDRGPKKKIKDFEPRLAIISQPRYNILNEKPIDPFKVRSTAKFYVPTERILLISKPKTLPPPPPLYDFEGNELPPRREWSFNSRKRIVASPRVVQLATPKFVKKKQNKDVKDDPFKVPRRALTAFCSPRMRELAEPVKRNQG